MFKVTDKFKDCTVYCSQFSVSLKDASQEQLEHLYHIGHEAVIADKKKVKNKPVDNLENEKQNESEGE
jgi:hypothetical protein